MIGFNLHAAAIGACGAAQSAAITGVAPTRGVASRHACVGCMAAMFAPTAPWLHASACGAPTQTVARLFDSCVFGFECNLHVAAIGVCGAAQFAAITGVAPTRGVATRHTCDWERWPPAPPTISSYEAALS